MGSACDEWTVTQPTFEELYYKFPNMVIVVIADLHW